MPDFSARLRAAFLYLVGAVIAVGVAVEAQAHVITLQVRDTEGAPLPARVHVVDGNGASWPAGPDSTAFAYYGSTYMRAYFYTAGDDTIPLVPGTTRIAISHGFEYAPFRTVMNLHSDTTLVVTLPRLIDLNSMGWFSGDAHVHTHHPPVDYQIDAQDSHFLAGVEGVNMTWLLDNGYNFRGGADPASSAAATLYYSTEFRNQAYGHVALLGLKDSLTYGCCLPPEAAYPMLTDLRAEWSPEADEAMSLCHPINGANFYDDNGWPAWGLAREIPVLAANGTLDVYDIASYGNLNDVQVKDWYALLNCGFQVPAGGGTDSRIDSYFIKPMGGYRSYVREPGPSNTPSDYVLGLRAGRSFVTNFPFILDFTVNGVEAGSEVLVSGPSVSAAVHFRVFSVVGVQTAKVIRNGEVVQTVNLTPSIGATDQTIDTTIQLDRSSWVAVRVDGTTNNPVAASPALFAHTSPVYFTMDALPQQSTVAAAHWLDWIDSLGVFVEMRGGWADEDHRVNVLSALENARNSYRAHFHVPPGNFALLAPDHGDTLLTGAPLHFDWEDASDPEPGDRVSYQLTIAGDSLFIGGSSQPATLQSELTLTNPFLIPNRFYYWRVQAIDRGNLRTVCTPGKRRFYWKQNTADAPTLLPERAPELWVWPNPSTVDVGLRPSVPLSEAWAIEILGIDGRRLARTGPGGEGSDVIRKRRNDLFVWSGRDAAGHRLASGSYYVRLVPLDGKSPNPPATRVLLVR